MRERNGIRKKERVCIGSHLCPRASMKGESRSSRAPQSPGARTKQARYGGEGGHSKSRLAEATAPIEGAKPPSYAPHEGGTLPSEPPFESHPEQTGETTGGVHPAALRRRRPARASLVWRRGWVFEVALAGATLQRGPAPSYLPTKGAHPFRNPRSNPTLKSGGEGGIRTHGPLTGTAVFETARFGHSRTSPLDWT